MLYVLLNVIAITELTIQFSNTTFSGTEKSALIKVSTNLLGGTASHDFTIFITTSPVNANGELLI